MHFISYQLKRAHLGCVRLGRDMFKDVGADEPEVDDDALPIITPARFDLLRVIWRWGCSMEQFGIREELGLSPSTVSKMITRLVALKVLTRYRNTAEGDDQRRSRVEMTDLGKRLYRQALQVVLGGRRLIRSFEHFVWQRERPPRSRRRWQMTELLVTLWDKIRDLSSHFGNTSCGEYPRHEHDGQFHKTKTDKKKPKYKSGYLPEEVFRERFPHLPLNPRYPITTPDTEE